MDNYSNILEKEDILVAEDDKDLRRLLQFDLESGDFKVRLAENGQIALDMVREKIPDCILLDVMMPVMDGFEVCKRLKSMDRTKDIPIIFLTARGATEDKVKAMGFNADDYVLKPFDFKELIARIKLQISKNNSRKYEVGLIKEKTVLAVVEELAERISMPVEKLRSEFLRLEEIIGNNQNGIDSLRECEMARRQMREVFNQMLSEIDSFYEPVEEGETVGI
ncbi:MAG: response regulator [Candidatus Krumholzibacteriota bacterium]|nr:response regulator [Candidatus Krumholzibacteriota bacterium]